jgi:hypothetical protein
MPDYMQLFFCEDKNISNFNNKKILPHREVHHTMAELYVLDPFILY